MATKKTTGRFDTRELLVERICNLMAHGDMSMEAIGKSVGVSQGTVAKIYHGNEGKECSEKMAQDGVDKGMKVVDDLVEDADNVRANLDVVKTEDGATYQVDLMSHSPEFQKYEIAKRVAHTLANSNLVPDAYRGRPNDAFVAINMGAEIGLEPFAAIQSIAVIDGKPCLYGDGLIGVVRASPKCAWIEETLSEDGKTATCKTQRAGEPKPVSASYSLDDAVQAGISTKNNWQKHTKRMLQMRARAYCLRDAYADLLKGLGVVEEMLDHDTTPAPITEYALPVAKQPAQTLGEAPPQVKATLAQVEHAIMQSESMEELLKAGTLAKQLNERDSGTARITYKKMRTALMEESADV